MSGFAWTKKEPSGGYYCRTWAASCRTVVVSAAAVALGNGLELMSTALAAVAACRPLASLGLHRKLLRTVFVR